MDESEERDATGCLLCGAPARRIQPRDDVQVYVWECAECGSWRAGRARELSLQRLSPAERQTIAERVRRVSRAGRVMLL